MISSSVFKDQALIPILTLAPLYVPSPACVAYILQGAVKIAVNPLIEPAVLGTTEYIIGEGDSG